MSRVGRATFTTIAVTVVLAVTPHDVRAATAPGPLDVPDGVLLREARSLDPADRRNRRAIEPGKSVPYRRELPPLYPPAEATDGPENDTESLAERQALMDKLVLWVRLRDDDLEPSFEAVVDFVEANPDWPQFWKLRMRAEEAITPDTPDALLLRWFDSHEPRTATGAMAFAGALARSGASKSVANIVRRAWVEIDMGARDETEFLRQFGDLLQEEHHLARLDRLLWERRTSASRRQMKRVGQGHRALADARLRLMRLRGGVDAAVDRVPARLANDPGLIFDRLRWRRRKDRNDGAVELLLALPPDAPHPRLWWREREIVARRLLSERDYETAYKVVAAHGMSGGPEYAEAEFLAGWIALRFIDRPQDAFKHFVDLYDSVSFSISLSRASFWAGRAAEAAEDKANATLWYRTAAAHVTTFYGQLAARKLDEPAPSALPNEPSISPQARRKFDRDELVRAVRHLIALRNDDSVVPANGSAANNPNTHAGAMLAGLEDDDALVPLLRHIAWRSRTAEEWVLAGQLAREADRNEIGVYIARRAARDGIILGDLGYPMLPLSDELPPDPALVHALVRQESGFDPGARSRAGARGLMQLMPGTARRVARSLKLRDHSTERLTSDPNHNVLLGSTYLESMLERFDGSMVMALAAYNAGPHRVQRWLKEYGDPRGSLDGTIDWIESIPFGETRNYVQRVLETLPIYRWKLEGGRVAVLRPEDLAGPGPGITTSETR